MIRYHLQKQPLFLDAVADLQHSSAVDAELIRLGLLRDLRDHGLPAFVKRAGPPRTVSEARRGEILRAIGKALAEVR